MKWQNKKHKRTRRGRPPKPGLRTPSGQLSRAAAAVGATDRNPTKVALAQPVRIQIGALCGEAARDDARVGYALGRLRIIGEMEERCKTDADRGRLHDKVRRAFDIPARNETPPGEYGISERQFWAGQRLAAAIGRERWVHSAPKDKPAAISFMAARGVDLTTRELSDAEAARYVSEYEDARAALLAAPLPPDARSALHQWRRLARAAGISVGLIMKFPGLVMPQAVKNVDIAVNHLVVDDRDLPWSALPTARLGFDALAAHFFGREERARRPRSDGIGDAFVAQRPDWPHEERAVDIIYADAPPNRHKSGG